MGFLRTAIGLTGWTSLGAAAGFVWWTRKNTIVDVPPTDYLFNHTLFARYNPNNAPVMQDLCVRKVPLAQLRPELVEKADKGALVEAFCAGVWSGFGYAIQRRFLERKYRGTETNDHLWDAQDLKSSTYEVGTKITDHFEVVSKTPSSIILRCGDSPRVKDVRSDDGLFEVIAEVNKEEGFAEFGMKSVFYNGLAQADGKPPVGLLLQRLHQVYDKLLMESAISNCTS